MRLEPINNYEFWLLLTFLLQEAILSSTRYLY